MLRQIIPTADRTKATVQVKVTIIDKDAQLRWVVVEGTRDQCLGVPLVIGACVRPSCVEDRHTLVERRVDCPDAEIVDLIGWTWKKRPARRPKSDR